MKQKITLEIQNDTGVEFEDTIELRPLRHGDYWFNGHDKIVGPIEGDYGARRHVLTPKVDHELEEAKKKFPVGSWFQTEKGSTIYQVKEVKEENLADAIFELVIHSDNYRGFLVSDCTPFPLPTWRCCETDKPKKNGYYYTRDKRDNSKRYGFYNFNHYDNSNYEWLDEGEL